MVVDVNRQGWAAVAWYHLHVPSSSLWEICFQIVDSANNVVIPDSFRLVSEDQTLNYRHIRPRVRWFDEDRFAVFWSKWGLLEPIVDTIWGVQAKLFDANGDSLSEIHTLLYDTYVAASFLHDEMFVSSVHDGRYAVAYERTWDGPGFRYYRADGFTADTSLEAVRGIFRFSPTEPHYYQHETSPCVDVSADRIVWVWQDNSRMRPSPDTEDFLNPYYTDIHCKITDWDVPRIDEPLQVKHPDDFEIITSIGSEVVLRYFDKPLGLHASIFDVTGRKVAEIHSKQTQGTIQWGEGMSPGVYFIVPSASEAQPSKVILVK